MGAGRVVPARGHCEGRDEYPVEPNSQNGSCLQRCSPGSATPVATPLSRSRPRRRRSWTADWTSTKEAWAILGRAINTMSQPGITSSVLTISRRRRFARFRTTAPPTRLLTRKPNRLSVNALGNARRVSRGVDHHRPRPCTTANSERRLRRACCIPYPARPRPSASLGLSADADAALLFPSGPAFESEIHERAYDGAPWVDRFFWACSKTS